MKNNILKTKILMGIKEGVQNKEYFLKDANFKILPKIIKKITTCLKKGGKILICGNGGSAADAQHLAAEFLVRLRSHKNRPPIAAIPLLMDTSTISACANDYDFNQIFKRNFEALVRKNDVLFLISTSGNSSNIVEVAKSAKKRNIYSVGFYGNKGGKAKKFTDDCVVIQSKNTARIQEAHIFFGHILFEEIEDNLY
jgi:D-sedoheptulose 7-phosphate isomerase|tara:strand:- start:2123 stop:2713 length:591 start_codon:yes stop_codon:yes gene_type:complete